MSQVSRQVRAAQMLLLMVVFQIPLFRTPCRSGVCETPLEVTVGQLAASRLMPPEAARALLLPGAILRSVRNGSAALTWEGLLRTYNMEVFESRTAEQNYRLEVMVGSYFVTFGSAFAMFSPGRMPIIGLLLTSWGLYKEGVFAPLEDYSLAVAPKIYPTFLIALILAIMALNLDKRKLPGVTGRGGGDAAAPPNRASERQPAAAARQKVKLR